MAILLKFMILYLAVFFSAPALSNVYKWLDQAGRIHFSDQKPQDKTVETVDLSEIITYASTTVLSNESTTMHDKNAFASKKIIMYSATWCGICKQAKKYFKKKKLAFIDYDIDKSEKARRDYKKLKARGVPVILVGKKRMNGFDVKKFESMYRS